LTTNLHVGTMGWSYRFWIDNFYSPDAKPETFLEEYSNHFNTVEVNNSFYQVPSVPTLENWKKQTPADFLFSLKFPKKITHEQLAEGTDYLDYFLGNVSSLGSKLGPLLLQFPPSFKSDQFDYLKNLVSVLPKRHRYALEFRNKSWLMDRFYGFLEENRIALVLGDSPWIHRVEKITADFTYFRWEGNRKQVKGNIGKVEKDRIKDTKIWADKMRVLPNSLDVFGYFSKYYSGHPPTDAKQLLNYFEA
jgi:uncharacterized protein YecE (DUF72 family)